MTPFDEMRRGTSAGARRGVSSSTRNRGELVGTCSHRAAWRQDSAYERPHIVPNGDARALAQPTEDLVHRQPNVSPPRTRLDRWWRLPLVRTWKGSELLYDGPTATRT